LAGDETTNRWAALGIRNVKDRRIFLQIKTKEERGHSSRSSSMAAHKYREKGRSAMGTTRSSKTGRGKGQKGREAHPKDASVLGEAGGGLGRPNFAGD
jgi:hypothetical protein